MNRRAIILLILAVAFGFSTGWFFRMQGNAQSDRALKVFGIKQGVFADLKSKPDLDDLAWISPSVAVLACGIRKSKIGLASEDAEWADVPMDSATTEQLNCIFALATRPSKYPLRFEISASKK